ncbi:MAG: hypothetical protein AB1671_23580 [Thermodesulfobacteriota bacterium]
MYAIDKQQQVLRIVAVGPQGEVYETVTERIHRPGRKRGCDLLVPARSRQSAETSPHRLMLDKC